MATNLDSVRYGIIGVGEMGSACARLLIENEIPNAIVTAVCDTKQNLLDKIAITAAEHDTEVRLFPNYKMLLSCGDVDAIIITVPADAQSNIGVEAFCQGLRVIYKNGEGIIAESLKNTLTKLTDYITSGDKLFVPDEYNSLSLRPADITTLSRWMNKEFDKSENN